MFQSWKLRFERFDEANPHVYELFERYTWQVIRSGKKNFSSGQVLGRMRWYVAFETDEPEFKINQNYAAYLGRKFMDLHPEHKGFFRLRALGEDRDRTTYTDLTPRTFDVDRRNYGGLGQHSIG